MLKPRPGCLCGVCLRWRTDRSAPFTQRIMAAADRVSARGRRSGLKLSRLKCKAGKPLSSILSHVPGISSPSHVSRGEQKISQSAMEADRRLVREVAFETGGQRFHTHVGKRTFDWLPNSVKSEICLCMSIRISAPTHTFFSPNDICLQG